MVESEALAAAVDVAAAVDAAAVVDVAAAADVLRRGRSFCSRRSIATKARNAGQTRVS